jgi:nitrogen regulatory protein P-II 2
MNRVTVVGEALARQALERLLQEVGAHGYTLFAVEGMGAQGPRPGDIREFGNIQVDVVLPEPAAARLLEQLEREFFPRFAMIAYLTEIRVLRPRKF